MLVEIINNDTNEKVKREKRAKDDEDDKVYVHVEVDLIGRLFLDLKKEEKINFIIFPLSK